VASYRTHAFDDLNDQSVLERLVRSARFPSASSIVVRVHEMAAIHEAARRALDEQNCWRYAGTGCWIVCFAPALFPSDHRRFRRRLETFGRVLDRHTRRSGRDAVRERMRREALDEDSRQHLAVIQQHFDIRSLSQKLSPECWEETDIVFQVPGTLLAAPLAWLEFGTGRRGQAIRLYESSPQRALSSRSRFVTSHKKKRRCHSAAC